MSKHCIVTGKKVASGHNVSHAHNKTKRRFFPNLQTMSFFSDTLRQNVRLTISTTALRTIEHHGGFEAWLKKSKPSDAYLKRLKKRLLKAEQFNSSKKG